MLKNTAHYLKKTLKPGRIIFKKEHLKNIGDKNFDSPYHNPGLLLTNPLFNIYNVFKGKSLYFDYKNLPNISIVKYLLPYNYVLKLQEISNDELMFETNGLIPYRTLKMIKDFHWKDCHVEPSYEINFDSALEALPTTTLKRIVYDAIYNQVNFGFKVSNSNEEKLKDQDYPDNYWGTFNCKFTPYTEKILKTM